MAVRRCVALLVCVMASQIFCAPAETPQADASKGAGAKAAADAQAADKVGNLPHIQFNVAKKQVRVECEALAVDAPLEFFCCAAHSNEHESVLRTEARPSHIHTALLAIGLKPGAPLTFIESAKKWIPPHGPPLYITVEFEKDGKTVSFPAYRWLREVKSHKEPKAFSWVFCGSRVLQQRYAADDTGYIVSIVNFDYALIDIPELASSSNETLEWERNAPLMPPKGTKVWMVIEPTGKVDRPATQPAAGAAADGPRSALGFTAAPQFQPPPAPTSGPADSLSDVHVDEAKVKALVNYHDKVIGPKAQALRDAAQAHYDVIAALRREQQRLISEADLIQRAIDELEKKYQDMTTPHPSGDEK